MTTAPARVTLSDVSDTVERDRRVQIGLRLNPSALTRVDQIAAAHEWTRSQVIRSLLRLGLAAWDRGQR